MEKQTIKIILDTFMILTSSLIIGGTFWKIIKYIPFLNNSTAIIFMTFIMFPVVLMLGFLILGSYMFDKEKWENVFDEKYLLINNKTNKLFYLKFLSITGGVMTIIYNAKQYKPVYIFIALIVYISFWIVFSYILANYFFIFVFL